MALDKFQPYLFVSAGEQSNKYLTPVISPEGIASFQAQRAQDISGLTIRIDPIQAGSGDPSPSNIRPISGRTGLTVTRAGKNLLPKGESHASNGITFAVNSDGTVQVSGTATATAFWGVGFTIPAGSYIHSGCPSGVTGLTCDIRNKLAGSGIPGIGGDSGNGASFTIDSALTAVYNIRVASGTTVNSVVMPMIRLASISDGTYAPYVGQTYPITWETEAGTVYGGTLDVVSGVLTVTDDQIASYAGETLPGEWISDRDVYVAGTTPTTGAQVVYKLATPQTYRLTGADVRTIAGFNQIYSDAGPVIDIKF